MIGFGLNIVVPKRKLGHNSFNQILNVMVANRIHFLTSLVLVPSRINWNPDMLEIVVLHPYFKTDYSLFG